MRYLLLFILLLGGPVSAQHSITGNAGAAVPFGNLADQSQDGGYASAGPGFGLSYEYKINDWLYARIGGEYSTYAADGDQWVADLEVAYPELASFTRLGASADNHRLINVSAGAGAELVSVGNWTLINELSLGLMRLQYGKADGLYEGRMNDGVSRAFRIEATSETDQALLVKDRLMIHYQASDLVGLRLGAGLSYASFSMDQRYASEYNSDLGVGNRPNLPLDFFPSDHAPGNVLALRPFAGVAFGF